MKVRLALLLTTVAALAVPTFAAGPYQAFTVTPCRLIDTRLVGAQTNGVALASATTYDFRVQGNCGVPAGATGVIVNATIVSPNGDGHLKLYPFGIAVPLISTLNFVKNEPALGNGATVPLSAVAVAGDKDLSVRVFVSPAGTSHLVIDVTGYLATPVP